MSSRREIVERELDVQIPEQYAMFLEKYGIYSAEGVEVYGMSDDLEHFGGPPCVIGATKIYRRKEGMPDRFLMLHSTGFDGEIMCLDTENGKVYAVKPGHPIHAMADSFDEWFSGYVLDPPREIRERREWLAAYWKQRAEELLRQERASQGKGVHKQHKSKPSKKKK